MATNISESKNPDENLILSRKTFYREKKKFSSPLMGVGFGTHRSLQSNEKMHPKCPAQGHAGSVSEGEPPSPTFPRNIRSQAQTTLRVEPLPEHI